VIRSKNRRSTRRWLGLVAATAATVMIATACSGGGSEPAADASNANVIKAEGEGVSLNEFGGAKLALGEPKKGGSLKVGAIAPIDTIDPTMPLSTPAISAANAVFDSLLNIGPEGEIEPGMAESLESKDKVHWTLKLRPDLNFSDGTPYDAEAVKAHLERYMAPNSQARDAGIARQITGLKVADPTTLEITIAAKSEEFPTLLTAGAGMVPSPTAVKKEGKQFGLKPVGAGPFVVSSFEPGGDLVLERNPNYYDPELPYLDKLTMVTATDTQARLSALQAGSIDLASTQVVSDFDKAKEAGLTVLPQPAYSYFYIMLNLSKPPFDDERMRQALAHGIDNQALATGVFDGKQLPMKGFLSTNHPEYSEVKYPSFDPEAAKKLVDEYKADGGDPSFEITITSPPEFKDQANIIQQMLKDVGISMKIDVSDQPTMITEGLAGNYAAQLRFIGFTLQATTDLAIRWTSTSPATLHHGKNPKLDKLIQQLTVTPVEQRHELYADVQQEMADWLPAIPLVQQVGGWIVGDKVGGFPGATDESTVDQVDAKYLWAK